MSGLRSVKQIYDDDDVCSVL